MTTKKRILAVDDESDVLLIIKTALFSEGFDVMTATNGPDALTAVRESTPDLIILDLMMPEMNGFEVLKALRDRKETASVPVIMLTGVSDRNQVRQALDAGFEYYIVKPFAFQDLVSKVKIALADAGCSGDLF